MSKTLSRKNNFIHKIENKQVVEKYHIPEGYLTFDDILKELAKHNFKLEKLPYTNKCKVFSPFTINLKKFGLLLGLPLNKQISPNIWTKSENECEINLGLKFISVHCDFVNKSLNFDTQGKRSSEFVSLPITSTQTLNGSVTHYKDIESEVSIYNGIWNELTFDVTTNLGKSPNIGSILLELYIK